MIILTHQFRDTTIRYRLNDNTMLISDYVVYRIILISCTSRDKFVLAWVVDKDKSKHSGSFIAGEISINFKLRIKIHDLL
jgi:hypothetical protein